MVTRLLRCFILLIGLLLFGTGCTQAGDDDVPATADPVAAMQASLQQTAAAMSAEQGDLQTRWLDELDTAVAKWEAANISSYTIEILYIDSSSGAAQRHVVTVEDGVMVENGRFCPSQTPNCIFQQIPEESLRVPGLFQTARNAILNNEINDNGAEFNFDPNVGIPEWIPLKSAGNNARYWHVESFTPAN